MTVCIDTNVVLRMFAASNECRPIFEAWFAGRLKWAVSTEILLEYEEVTLRRAGSARTERMFQVISLVDTVHHNVLHISPAFRFRLPHADPDDQKFTDCAIAAEADFVITSDHHFDGHKGSGYKPQPITPEEFILLHLPAGR